MSKLTPDQICPVEARTKAERDLGNARLHGAIDALIELLEKGIADLAARQPVDK